MVSVELEEIISGGPHLVLYRGQIQGELDAKTASEEEVGILMAGGQLDQIEKRKE